MAHKIFLSHNSNDKPLVEPVAMKLAEIFGQDKIFYDSWSIRPGDSIIEKMDQGLDAPEFVFFFVSTKSLASGMVKLEWQNALYAASRGKTRIIPVRIDNSKIPSVLMQTLYIDMFTIGLDAAIAQIVKVCQGDSLYEQQHSSFSNLTFTASSNMDGSIDISVRASHLMEQNIKLLVMVDNAESEVSLSLSNISMYRIGNHPNAIMNNKSYKLAIAIEPVNFTLTPSKPIIIKISKKEDVRIIFLDLMYEVGVGKWKFIPRSFA